MKVRAIGKALESDIKKAVKWSSILWGMAALFIVMLIFSMHKSVALTAISSLIIFFCVMAGSIVSYELPSRLRARKMIGKNAYIEMDENSIKVYDTVCGNDIENEFKWSDFEYIHFKAYNTDMRAVKRYYGLLFVADKDRFYKAVSRRKRRANYVQRKEEMSAGFFIGCDRETAKRIEEYWGREIR